MLSSLRVSIFVEDIAKQAAELFISWDNEMYEARLCRVEEKRAALSVPTKCRNEEGSFFSCQEGNARSDLRLAILLRIFYSQVFSKFFNKYTTKRYSKLFPQCRNE